MRLLDSDACIHLLRARQPHLGVYARLKPGTVFISSVTYNELYYGALHSSAGVQRHLDTLEDFVGCIEILPFTSFSAQHSASVRERLTALGTPIGPLDTMIAGHALEHELTLVTGNMGEFSRVEGLKIENWAD